MDQTSDVKLFELLKEGDKEALSVLFLRYYDPLLHYGCQITTQDTLVEECIQELFMYIFESYSRLGEVKNVKAYLYRSLRRRVIEQVKKQQKRRSGGKPISLPTDIHFSADDLLLQEDQLRESLIRALNQLPWRQREAIYLRYFNRLSTKEIAEVMGIADQTVLNTLYRALQKIKKDFNLKEFIGYFFPWVILFFTCM